MHNLSMTLKHEIAFQGARLMRGMGKGPKNSLSTDPIRLFWWTNRVNFGDVLSPVIVKYISGRDVEWASLDDCTMTSTGSIYGWLRLRSKRYMRDVHIWGSGIQSPHEAVGRLDYIHHHLLRGPMTTIAAEDDSIPTGDPGLLGPEAVGVTRATDARGIGIIPHVADWSRSEEIEAYKALPGIRLIDYRSDDCAGVIEEMAACERIYSSSLHGLILSDALSIPNFRFVGKRYATSGWDFKFNDYGLSVGRHLWRPVDVMEHIRTPDTQIGPEHTAYLAAIPAKKAEIAGSFPYDVFGGDPAIAATLTG